MGVAVSIPLAKSVPQVYLFYTETEAVYLKCTFYVLYFIYIRSTTDIHKCSEVYLTYTEKYKE